MKNIIKWPIPPINTEDYNAPGYIPEKIVLYEANYRYHTGDTKEGTSGNTNNRDTTVCNRNTNVCNRNTNVCNRNTNVCNRNTTVCNTNVCTGVLEIDMEDAPVDYNKIKLLVDDSYSTFLNLLNGFESDHLDRIVQIHSEINEILNKGKAHEKEEAFRKARETQHNRIKRVIEEIEKKSE